MSVWSDSVLAAEASKADDTSWDTLRTPRPQNEREDWLVSIGHRKEWNYTFWLLRFVADHQTYTAMGDLSKVIFSLRVRFLITFLL